jgi:5-methylcytosine-specific restriction endonuclease McrBC GTP-binding regulatory subunit McrB
MPFTPQQRLIIKESSELYGQEVARINDLIENKSDDNRCNQLYLLRAIATIEHTKRIGLLNDEEMTDEYLEAVTKEVNLSFPQKDDGELFDDIAILEDDVKARFFNNPAKEKQTLVAALGLTL